MVAWLRNQNYGVPTLPPAPDRIDALVAARPRPSRRLPWIGSLGGAIRLDIPALRYGLAFDVTYRELYPFATSDDLAAAGREALPKPGTVCVASPHTLKVMLQRTGPGIAGSLPPHILTMSRRGGPTCHFSALCSSRFSS